MACDNKDYQKFCAKIFRLVPLCDGADKKELCGCLAFSEASYNASLILQLFELRKLFVEKNMVKFHAHGTCMFPVIRPNDKLYVSPKTVDEIKIGDVAVYRRHNRLFAHRTIEKGYDKNRSLPYIITRPDTAKLGNDGPSFDEDIVGVIEKLERRGRVLNTEKKDCGRVKKFLHRSYLEGRYFFMRLLRRVMDIFCLVQQSRIYRNTIGLLFKYKNKHIKVSMTVPMRQMVDTNFYRKVSRQELLESLREAGVDAISRYSIDLKFGSKKDVSISMVHKPEYCSAPGWWVSDIRIRVRYRGTAIEERLFEEAEDLLRQIGAKEAYIGIPEKDRAYIEMLKNAGFKKFSVSKDALLKEAGNKPLMRIIMKKEIV